MPITLQDGFIISANFPVDYRFTVTNVSDLSGITKLYVGLKTYVTSVDKTYVYTSTGWKVDSGGSTTNIENNDWTTNIYGSGSVVGDFELFLGTVSNAKNDRSFYYNLWSRGLTDGDQSKILNYFYRNANGNDWDTMAFRIQHQLKPTGGETVSSAYIDFNPSLTMSGVPVYADLATDTIIRKNIDLINKNGIILSSGGKPINMVDGTNRDDFSSKLGIDSKSINFYFDNAQTADINLGEYMIPPVSIFTMSQTDSHKPYTDVIFGLNSSADPVNRYTISPFRPSYRMRMGVQDFNNTPGVNNFEKNLLSFDIRPANYNYDVDQIGGGTNFWDAGFSDGVWHTALQINAQKNPIDLDTPSPVRISVDDSSRDWDFKSLRDYKLLTPQEVVRKLEHRYEKIQIWNQGSSFRIVNQTLTDAAYNVLYLSTDGNSFDVELPAGQELYDIRPDKSTNPNLDFPVGTIIHIKFRNADKTRPGCLRLQRNPTLTELRYCKFKSEINESTFLGYDDTRLYIYHDDNFIDSTSEFGDVITFRRTKSIQDIDVWEIIGLNRESRITKRAWILDSAQDPYNQSYWDFSRTDGPRGSISTGVNYLSVISTSGIWRRLTNTTVTNDGITRWSNPGIWPWQNDLNPVTATRIQTNPNGFKLRFSVDGNRLVFCQGNFKIDGTTTEIMRSSNVSLNKIFFKTNDNRKNVWNVGFVFKSGGYNILLPRWEGNFTRVRMYGTGKQTTAGPDQELIFSNEILSINKDGQIMLEFFVEPTNTGQLTNLINVKIDVSVPPFSYHSVGPTQSFRSV